jgi:predicted DNA-binding WGR domain protein
MVEAKLQIVLRRHEPTRNVSRYYVLAIEPSLYGDAALVRAWGRIGSLGRQRLDLYATADAAGEALELWLARKKRRGYAPAACEARFGTRPKRQFRISISTIGIFGMRGAERSGGDY